MPLDLDAGAGGLAPQFLLLPVHVMADGAAGERADAGADDPLGAVAAAADQVAEEIAADRADTRADRGLGNALLASIGIGDAGGGGGEEGGSEGGGDAFGHWHEAVLSWRGVKAKPSLICNGSGSVTCRRRGTCCRSEAIAAREVAPPCPRPSRPFPGSTSSSSSLLVALNGVFAMSELAIVSSRRPRLKAMARAGPPRRADRARARRRSRPLPVDRADRHHPDRHPRRRLFGRQPRRAGRRSGSPCSASIRRPPQTLGFALVIVAHHLCLAGDRRAGAQAVRAARARADRRRDGACRCCWLSQGDRAVRLAARPDQRAHLPAAAA